MRPDRFPCDLQPPAEIPGITTDRVVPRHADSPQEPEPAQQIHAIRTDRQLRPPGRPKMAKIGPGPRPGWARRRKAAGTAPTDPGWRPAGPPAALPAQPDP